MEKYKKYRKYYNLLNKYNKIIGGDGVCICSLSNTLPNCPKCKECDDKKIKELLIEIKNITTNESNELVKIDELLHKLFESKIFEDIDNLKNEVYTNITLYKDLQSKIVRYDDSEFNNNEILFKSIITYFDSINSNPIIVKFNENNDSYFNFIYKRILDKSIRSVYSDKDHSYLILIINDIKKDYDNYLSLNKNFTYLQKTYTPLLFTENFPNQKITEDDYKKIKYSSLLVYTKSNEISKIAKKKINPDLISYSPHLWLEIPNINFLNDNVIYKLYFFILYFYFNENKQSFDNYDIFRDIIKSIITINVNNKLRYDLININKIENTEFLLFIVMQNNKLQIDLINLIKYILQLNLFDKKFNSLARCFWFEAKFKSLIKIIKEFKIDLKNISFKPNSQIIEKKKIITKILKDTKNIFFPDIQVAYFIYYFLIIKNMNETYSKILDKLKIDDNILPSEIKNEIDSFSTKIWFQIRNDFIKFMVDNFQELNMEILNNPLPHDITDLIEQSSKKLFDADLIEKFTNSIIESNKGITLGGAVTSEIYDSMLPILNSFIFTVPSTKNILYKISIIKADLITKLSIEKKKETIIVYDKNLEDDNKFIAAATNEINNFLNSNSIKITGQIESKIRSIFRQLEILDDIEQQIFDLLGLKPKYRIREIFNDIREKKNLTLKETINDKPIVITPKIISDIPNVTTTIEKTVVDKSSNIKEAIINLVKNLMENLCYDEEIINFEIKKFSLSDSNSDLINLIQKLFTILKQDNIETNFEQKLYFKLKYALQSIGGPSINEDFLYKVSNFVKDKTDIINKNYDEIINSYNNIINKVDSFIFENSKQEELKKKFDDILIKLESIPSVDYESIISRFNILFNDLGYNLDFKNYYNDKIDLFEKSENIDVKIIDELEEKLYNNETNLISILFNNIRLGIKLNQEITSTNISQEFLTIVKKELKEFIFKYKSDSATLKKLDEYLNNLKNLQKEDCINILNDIENTITQNIKSKNKIIFKGIFIKIQEKKYKKIYIENLNKLLITSCSNNDLIIQYTKLISEINNSKSINFNIDIINNLEELFLTEFIEKIIVKFDDIKLKMLFNFDINLINQELKKLNFFSYPDITLNSLNLNENLTIINNFKLEYEIKLKENLKLIFDDIKNILNIIISIDYADIQNELIKIIDFLKLSPFLKIKYSDIIETINSNNILINNINTIKQLKKIFIDKSLFIEIKNDAEFKSLEKLCYDFLSFFEKDCKLQINSLSEYNEFIFDDNQEKINMKIKLNNFLYFINDSYDIKLILPMAENLSQNIIKYPEDVKGDGRKFRLIYQIYKDIYIFSRYGNSVVKIPDQKLIYKSNLITETFDLNNLHKFIYDYKLNSYLKIIGRIDSSIEKSVLYILNDAKIQRSLIDFYKINKNYSKFILEIIAIRIIRDLNNLISDIEFSDFIVNIIDIIYNLIEYNDFDINLIFNNTYYKKLIIYLWNNMII